MRRAEQDHEDIAGDRERERQDRRPAEVATDARQRDVAGRRDLLALLRTKCLERPQPALVSVSQEEEQQEEAENKNDKKSAGEDPDKSLPVLPLALIGGVLATGALLTIFLIRRK